jgi:hypothetical protein
MEKMNQTTELYEWSLALAGHNQAHRPGSPGPRNQTRPQLPCRGLERDQGSYMSSGLAALLGNGGRPAWTAPIMWVHGEACAACIPKVLAYLAGS